MVHNSPWWQCLNIEIELDKANFANSSLNKFRFLDEFAMVMVMMMASSKPGPSDKVGLSLCLKLDGKFIKPLDSVVATKSKSVESFSVKSFLSCCHKGRQWQPAMANCNQKSKQKGYVRSTKVDTRAMHCIVCKVKVNVKAKIKGARISRMLQLLLFLLKFRFGLISFLCFKAANSASHPNLWMFNV